MRTNRTCPLILSVVLLTISWTGAVIAEEPIQAENTELWDIVEDAYIYCYPLVVVDATLKKFTNTEIPTPTQAPINQLAHSNFLFTADNRLVVSPNVDDIYSSAFLDLHDSAFVFVKPKTDRFSSVQILDAYTNTVEVVGSGSKTDNPDDEVICLITGRDYQGDVPEGMNHIVIPTDMAWIIIRTVINDPSDLPNVEAIQQKMMLVPLDVYMNNETYVPKKGTYNAQYNFNPAEYVYNMSAEEFFSTANALMINNPPSPDDTAILDTMKQIHVGPGLVFNASILGPDGAERWNSMVGRMESDLIGKTKEYMTALDGWKYYGEPIGEWGTAYAYRALIAIKGLGANPTSVAIYPMADTDTDGEKLTGAHTYRLHIEKDMLPPVIRDGFWSFTVYGSDNYLIPNEIDRYCINDRSNVTYNEDGSLDILLQAEKPADEMMNNWLPVGNQDFHIYLRIYGPDLEKIKSNWTPPKIVKNLVPGDNSGGNSTQIQESVVHA